MDLTPERLVGSLIVLAMFLLVAFPIHEFAHAFAAFQLGDGTARLMGRLTLDPRAHFDPPAALLLAISVLAPAFGIGWAKPTPVQPDEPARRALGRGDRRPSPGRSPTSFSRSRPRSRCATCYATDMDVPAPRGRPVLLHSDQPAPDGLQPHPHPAARRVEGAVRVPRPPDVAGRSAPVLEQYGLIILVGAIFLPIFGGTTRSSASIFGEVLEPADRPARRDVRLPMRPGSVVVVGRQGPPDEAPPPRPSAGTGARRRRCLAEPRAARRLRWRCTSPTGATGSTSSPRFAPAAKPILRCCSPASSTTRARATRG